ncbi:aminotransferase class V-fold PLP-dependent enzyme [bacterium]|nr:aminotransferase class V-fold PLP-dependent enzyme [bacterium]
MAISFDPEHFPIKQSINFQAHCSVSHLNKPAADRAVHFLQRHVAVGRGLLFEYTGDEHIAKRFHQNFAALMKTTADNITMTTNTSEAISMIANGYPFEPGDQVISYVNEYPANHYPWVVQAKRRGVELILLSDTDVPQEDRPYTGPIDSSMARGWSFEELESRVTDRTRIIAISHVQFTSGYAADLKRLGDFCKSKDIDLVVDAAQSLGCLPVYPEQWNVAAVAAAGWKWLLGPVGTGVMYTRPDFRDKIEITMSGADHMVQDTEYLDHNWNPHTDGRKFEYSTVSYALVDGLSVGVEEVFLKHSPEAIRDHIFDLQELALSKLDMQKYQPVVHEKTTRSGILSLIPKVSNAPEICKTLEAKDIVMTPRDGYVRFAPHLCTTPDEIEQAVTALNEIV